MKTPVALIIFRRPETTERVFAEIAKAKPPKLLVIANSPRPDNPEEVEKCRATRSIIERVNWDCEVLKNFADTHRDVRTQISGGVSWVFREVEEAIILEDDCLPAPSFFGFCEQLLERYRDDERVMHVSGDNFQGERSRTADSYYFSRYCHVWGWASWRRAWRHYDVGMRTWPESRELIRGLFADEAEADYWTGIFDRVHAGEIDTWDYQWVYACWSQSGLAVTPDVNLVSNLGFGPDATHTRGESDMARLPVGEMSQVRHPQLVVRHGEADRYSFDHVFGGLASKEEAARRAASASSRPHLARRAAGRVLRYFRNG